MTNEYDEITAFHYSEFRPGLHSKILAQCLVKNYDLGLDIGCGTGHSAIALSNFCKKVVGIEPSQKMLRQAIQHQRVEYRFYDTHSINAQNDEYDLVSFAGSLFYAKSHKLLEEVIRVCKNGATIVVYDFEIILQNILNQLVETYSYENNSDYDHSTNFDGLGQDQLKKIKEMNNIQSLEISVPNLTHLLLSSKDHYTMFSQLFGANDLYKEIVKRLQNQFPLDTISIKAKIYATIYQVVKSPF